MADLKTDKRLDKLRTSMLDLSDLLATERDIEDIMRADHADVFDELDELIAARDAAVKKLDDGIASMRVRIAEEVPEAQDVEKIKADITKAFATVKKLAHGLPIELLVNGVTVNEHGIKVKTNKAKTTAVFKDSVLSQYPELRTLKMDGFPAVVPTIDGAVVEALVENGDITSDVFEFRIVSLVRAPSTTVKVVDDA